MNKIFSLLICLTLVIGPVTVHADDERAMDAYTKDGGTGSDTGKAFYMMQAGMISTAITGASMTTCVQGSYHWAHWLFVAGGAVFVVGEIATAKEKSDYHKRKKEVLEIDDSKLVGPGENMDQAQRDIQTQALLAAKEEEENNKKSMEKRKKWADVVAIIYDLAAISAGVEGVLSLFPVYTGFVPDTLVCAGLPAIAMPLYLVFNTIYTANAAVDLSGGKLGLSTLGFMALLKIELAIALALGSASTMSAWLRLVYFGAAAILAHKVSDGIKDRIEIADANIAKLNAALCAWGVPVPDVCPAPSPAAGAQGGAVAGGAGGGDGGTVAGSSSGAGGGGLGTSNYLQRPASTFPRVNGKCVGSSSAGIEHSSSACKKPLIFSRNMPKFKIKDLGTYNQHAFNFADAVAKGDSGDANSAGISANALLTGAARIKEIKNEVFKDVNDQRVKAGGKAQDINAAIDAQYKSMMKSMSDGAAKSGFGTGLDAGAKSTLDATPADSSQTATAPVVAVPGAVGAVAPPPDLFPGSTEGDLGPTGLTEAEKDVLAEDYAKNKNEYLSNNQDSLFQVLSKTYVRNLDKILIRKKKIIEETPKEE